MVLHIKDLIGKLRILGSRSTLINDLCHIILRVMKKVILYVPIVRRMQNGLLKIRLALPLSAV